MKIKELRVGNYVILFGNVATVQRSDFSKNEHGIAIESGKPIPITDQWLSGLGLENGLSEVLMTNTDGDSFYLFDIPEDRRKYVHQLQNLYFALTGEELKIQSQ